MHGLSPSLAAARRAAFPVGAGVTLESLTRDPYAVYRQLRDVEPVSWLPALGMWYLTRHEDVQAVLLDTARFTTASARSPIQETFGEQVLTTEGLRHDRYRRAFQADFAKSRIGATLEEPLRRLATQLVDGFRREGRVEMRAAFASRLPIQAMLALCGLPLDAEARLRGWYDHFEAALANFGGDPGVRARAARAADELHAFLQAAIEDARGPGAPSLLRTLVNAPSEERLADEEIRRNLGILFFGGISTVEALVLNGLWAFHRHPELIAAARADSGFLPAFVDETIRWHGPVQSATRHALCAATLGAADVLEGEIVNCMLGAANRDPAVFPDPDRFVLGRPNIRRHLAFAAGPHACLGFHLAKLEAQVALEVLLARLPGLQVVADGTEPPRGYEFHQPRQLTVAWHA